MFMLYKMVGAFAAPPGLFVVVLLLLALLSFLLSIWKSCSCRKFFTIPMLLLALLIYFMSIPAGARLITGSLELRWPPRFPPDEEPAAILVLGGGSSYNASGSSVQPSPFSLERVFEAVKIAKRRSGFSVLVLSGGSTYGKNDRAEASVLQQAAREMGWQGDVILETRSRSTAENMKYCAKIAKELKVEDVIVVTNAFHMPRAMHLAARYMPEMKLYSAPGPFYTDPTLRGAASFLPDSSSLYASCLGVREMIGIAASSIFAP